MPQSLDGFKTIRVLVVDDYSPLADHLAKVLCNKGYKAVAVYSGIEALRAGEQFSPHALIADVMMPGMNGAELVFAFAEKFPDCRSLLMTANQWAPEIFIGGLRIKVLQKPFDLKEIFGFLGPAPPMSWAEEVPPKHRHGAVNRKREDKRLMR